MTISDRAGLLMVGLVITAASRAEAVGSRDLEVDIETARSKVYATTEGWKVEIKYKIELENAPPDEQFELEFYVTECDRTLMDHAGRPVRIVVPLQRPYKCSKDKRKFKGTFKARLPDGSFACPDQLYLSTRVVRASDRCVLARKVKAVSYGVPHSIHFGFGIGVSICH